MEGVGRSAAHRRLFAILGFETALVAVAAALGRVTLLLLTIVAVVCVIEVRRFLRASDAPLAATGAVAARRDQGDGMGEGVRGTDLAADAAHATQRLREHR